MGGETNIVKKKVFGGINIDLSVMGLLLILILFFGRCFYIMTNSFDRGALPYVQLLNYGLPVVEEVAYNEEDFAESYTSLKSVALEAIGINEDYAYKILKTELPYLGDNLIADSGEVPGYDDFKLGDDSVAKYDKEEQSQYEEELKEALKTKKPKILIVNTHTTENYAESGGKFTTNKNHSVVGVAEVIEKELKEKYGVDIIFDKTVHDVSYNDAYKRTQETYKRYVEKYGNNFDMVIDLHRDGTKSTNKKPFYAKVNGEDAAKIMFVNSKSSPYFAQNDKMARELIKITNKLYPGLNRQNEPWTYNTGIYGLAQQVAKNSVIIEVGANISTTKEAQKSGEYIARVIAEYLKEK
ncbi:stage II sporulation protein P [uncultured Clostridium sp.]|uniref:stage II sporulation protein P n=1 Tax=uncultured Clostridium sp. TaxID=59620 RepID=UPI00260F94A0|nr:stage II sporulation protein P [uncultured Clostridium sp.]